MASFRLFAGSELSLGTVRPWDGSASHLLGSVVVIGSANVLVDQQRQLRRATGGTLATVLQDGGDRGVGPGAEHQRAGTGGINAFGVVALDQAQNADAGAEALLGMR